MFKTIDRSKLKQIRTLLFVLGSGLGLGILGALGMLYYYNPTNTYLAKNVLLTPDNVATLRFHEGASKKSGVGHFVLDDIQYLYFDPAIKQTKHLHVDLEKYAQFYAIVSNENSIDDAEEQVKAQFNTPNQSSLVFKVRPESASQNKESSKTFLRIDFSPDGNYYRVLLREQNATDAWAYFFHAGIGKQVHNLMIPAL